MGMNEVLVESGPTLAGACIEAGVVDELILYLAPQCLGHLGREAFTLPSINSLQQRVELEFTDVRQIGADIRLTAIPRVG